jgi:hypothetical protein
MATWIEEKGDIPDEYTGIQSETEQQEDEYVVEDYLKYYEDNDLKNYSNSDYEFQDNVAKAQWHYDNVGKKQGKTLPTTTVKLNGTPNWLEYANQNKILGFNQEARIEGAKEHFSLYGAHQGLAVPVNEYAKTTYYQRYYTAPEEYGGGTVYGERGTSETPASITQGTYYRFSATPNAEVVQKQQYVEQKQREMMRACSAYRGAQYNACVKLVNQQLAGFASKSMSGYAKGGEVKAQPTKGTATMEDRQPLLSREQMNAPAAPAMVQEDMPSLMDTSAFDMPTEEEINTEATASKLMGMLEPEEVELISTVVEMHPDLLPILDKIDMMIGASEFEGEGPVNGPGTETSDSIPAKLSDGEFVFTAKAVKQLGVDKLRKMMSKAEDEYDNAMSKQERMAAEGFAMGGLLESVANQNQSPRVETQPMASATSGFMMPQKQTVPMNVNGAGNQMPAGQQGIMASKTVDLQNQYARSLPPKNEMNTNQQSQTPAGLAAAAGNMPRASVETEQGRADMQQRLATSTQEDQQPSLMMP